MFLEVQKEWEIQDPVMQTLAGDNVMHFNLVRVSLNMIIFHLDLSIKDEDELGLERIHRIICTDICQAAVLASNPTVISSKIAMQTRRCDNDGVYAIDDIEEVYLVESEPNNRTMLYCCLNGKKVFEDWDDAPKNYKIVKMIYGAKVSASSE